MRRSRTSERTRGEQRGVVDRLGEEIVGAGLEPAHAVGCFRERGHHHHRNVGGAGIGLEALAGLEAVHARHHHVEQDEIGTLFLGDR